jgi:hypothetical protein
MINPKTDTAHVLMQPHQEDTIWISSSMVEEAYAKVVPDLLEFQSPAIQLRITIGRGIALVRALGFGRVIVTDTGARKSYSIDFDTGLETPLFN